MIRNTPAGWGSISRGFHWILAAATIGMIGFGWWVNHVPARPDRFFYRSIHADIGYVVLLLTILRLLWRVGNLTPALPDDSRPWQKIAARISHAALYLITIMVAMLGWAHSGAHAPDYSSFFGLFHVPQFTSPDREAARAYEDRHILFAYVLLALIVVHIAAAAWHHYIRRDRVAVRMLTEEAKAG
ncbi:cytochrome b [Bradyrhizobium sp. CB82]|uniref:cytochrome b n=1 Tax=Bradyrhizobium sp. CB82 TaxID=3039159 RepID=UPI0024B1300A|nr:cytochrome b [Bradyrhizobium sp. CB82]WFU43909.1 cytochrome b [Bradyrhizobium sp. CB82]